MYISKNWLLRFINLPDLLLADLAETVTTRIAEVERTLVKGKALDEARVVLVKSVSQHPNKKGVRVALVSNGSEEFTIVCSANNLEVGQLVPCVFPGGSLRSAVKNSLIQVESIEVSGVQSQGVLCSEFELDIGSGHDGLLLLDSRHFKVGNLLSDIIGPPDELFEIDNKSLTHRPDLWSHLGFARELSAIFHCDLLDEICIPPADGDLQPLHLDSLKDMFPKQSFLGNDEGIHLSIDPNTGSDRFTCLMMDVNNDLPSPLWLQRFLHNMELSHKNLLVDISNFILFDVGQPNHMYDADKLPSLDVSVRKAYNDEGFDALNGSNYTLTEDDVVVSAGDTAVALAGVIGGRDTAVQDKTSRILFESAHFSPRLVRQTCKNHQLRTDSSNRFEKSLSPDLVSYAHLRILQLFDSMGVKHKVRGLVQDLYPSKQKIVSIPFNFSNIQQRLSGVPKTEEEALSILKRLGFRESLNKENKAAIKSQTPDPITDSLSKSSLLTNSLIVPWYRASGDVSIESDLVEEIGRSIGYENVPQESPKVETHCSDLPNLKKFQREISTALVGIGYSEVTLYSNLDRNFATQLGYDCTSDIQLQNSVDTGRDLLRSSLVPGILEACKKNIKANDSFAMFELGRSYHAPDKLSFESSSNHKRDPNYCGVERNLLSLALVSSIELVPTVIDEKVSSGLAFYSMVSTLRRICAFGSTAPLSLEPFDDNVGELEASQSRNFKAIKKWMHPYRAASLKLGDLYLGTVAEVRPSVAKVGKQRLVLAEIDIDAVLATAVSAPYFKEFSKHPSSFFELSIVAKKKEYSRDILSRIKRELKSFEDLKHTALDGAPETTVSLLSIYNGKPLAEEDKSVSIVFSLSFADRTVTAEELEDFRTRVLTAVSSAGYKLRS